MTIPFDHRRFRIELAGARAQRGLDLATFDEAKHRRGPGGKFAKKVGALGAKHGVEVSVSHASAGTVLQMLRSQGDARGKGKASAALKDLVRLADEHGETLALTPDPVGKGGLSKSALKAWYASHGFVPNSGRNKDYSFRETMIREPSKPKPRVLKGSKPPGAKLGVRDFRLNDDGSFETVGVHNTSPEHAKAIREQGWDVSKSSDRGVFGKALYFETAGAGHYADDETEEVHARVRLSNPLIGNIHDMREALGDTAKSDIAKRLAELGRDGLVLLNKERTEPRHVMAFDPKQVEAA